MIRQMHRLKRAIKNEGASVCDLKRWQFFCKRVKYQLCFTFITKSLIQIIISLWYEELFLIRCYGIIFFRGRHFSFVFTGEICYVLYAQNKKLVTLKCDFQNNNYVQYLKSEFFFSIIIIIIPNHYCDLHYQMFFHQQSCIKYFY